MNLIGKVVEKEKLVGELSQGVEYYKGERGPKGDAFTYEDFTQEQLNALRGPQGEPGQKGDKGDAFTYADFTQEQLEALRGPQGIQGVPGETGPAGQPGQDGKDGKDFTYEDFTQEQLESLRGPQGEPGRDGSNGLDGKDGKDGVSVSHTWNGTSLSITSASGTSEMDLRGPAGQDGQDYVLTQDDKTEIAGLVDVSGFATEEYVNNAVAGIEIPDVSGFQTEEQVNTLINQALGVIENGTY